MFKKLLLTSIILLSFGMYVHAQYCTPTLSTGCTSNDIIDNFSTTGGITNITNLSSGCNSTSPNGYVFNIGMAVSQVQGGSFNFEVQAGPTWSQSFAIWIDWNQDQDFDDAGENVYLSGAASTSLFSGSITVPANAVPGPTRMRVLCKFSAVLGASDYCSAYTYGECEDYVMEVIANTACAGVPNAGSASPSNVTLCAGQTQIIGITGASYTNNLSYQWIQSNNGGASWTNVTGGSNPNVSYYQTPILNASVMYACIFTCNTSGLSDTSAPINITITGPTYANIPFTEDFESWSNYCNTSDVPYQGGLYWSNSPSAGNESWRRNDQGGTAGWTSPNFFGYIPGSSMNQYSARFHSSETIMSGNLDLYVDCSQQAGNKEIYFDYINDNSLSGLDEMEVFLSDDGGLTFNSIGNYFGATTWQTNNIVLNTNSPNTIVRFTAYGDFGTSDIGIDNLRVLPPCNGMPTAGIIDSTVACANTAFNLYLSGNTQAAGMTYEWYSASAATGPWTLINTTNTPYANFTISNTTYFQCTVTCTASGFTATTPVRFIDLASFYYCYCSSMSNPNNVTQNIGNVEIKDAQGTTLLNNGIAIPLTSNASSLNLYTNFTNLAPIPLMKDSTYTISATAFTQNSFYFSSYVSFYIDYNHDGIFDPVSEYVTGGNNTSTTQKTTGNFIVPNTALFGLTGLRVVYQEGGSATTNSPCGQYFDGETEDYLVDIVLPPCKTPPNAGMAIISDLITCPGYTVFLTDTTHDLIYNGLTFNWQVSSDGIVFTDIPGATSDTASYVVNGDTWFRFKTTCNGVSNGYSNIVNVTMSPPFACYGNSQATGGILDSSDIGAFIISEKSTNNNLYSFITGGPHLNNPLAVRRRTDYTYFGAMELYSDSVYKFSVYHILKGLSHADAKVTVFIDYNNNKIYDIPSERVYSGIADINNFYLNGEIQCPISPAFNVSTGLRVILNNNLSPNAASDNGVGAYVSGETEDYLVRFKQKPIMPTAVNNLDIINDIGIYPNPASNKVYIGFTAQENLDINIQLVSLTGSIIHTTNYPNVMGSFITEMNIGQYAKGTYFIQINTEKGKYVRKLIIE